MINKADIPISTPLEPQNRPKQHKSISFGPDKNSLKYHFI